MPTPLATWNRARGVWETTRVALCGHSAPFSQTWPTSGSMRAGVAYELPTWAPPTADTGSSSPPGLLATPTASIATGGRPQDSHGKRDLRLDLLPTPAAGNFNDGESVESWQARKARELAKGRNGNGIGTPLAMAVKLLPTPTTEDHGYDAPGRTGGGVVVDELRDHGAAADSSRVGWGERRPEPAGLVGGSDAALGGGVDWGSYAPAIGRWELILGRPAPAPTQTGARGGQQLAPRFVEFLMGLPEGHVTAVPGLSRGEQLRMLGNGVVPQQAAAGLRFLLSATGGAVAA